MDSTLLLAIIKLCASGLVSFLAILLMSKKREAAWSVMVAGFLFSYAALIYELLTELGIIYLEEMLVFGLPLSRLLCAVLPSLCFIISFIMMIAKRK